MSPLRPKRLAIIALVLGSAGVGIILLLSSSFAQLQMARWAFAALDRQLGIIGHADTLTLDIARLDLRLGGLTLAARDTPDTPFFTVDEARVDLPWSAVWRSLSIETVELGRPALTIFGFADGTSNLPGGTPSGSVAGEITRVARRAGRRRADRHVAG